MVLLGGIGLNLLSETTYDSMRFQRSNILDGEYYRMLSAHLIHLNSKHLLINLFSLGLLCLLTGVYRRSLILLCTMLVTALAVSAGLLIFNPEINWYVGSSGVIHGIAVVAVGTAVNIETRSRVAIQLLLVVKLVYEQVSGPSDMSTSLVGGNIIVDAHLYGFCGGWLVFIVWNYLLRQPYQYNS